MRRTLTIILLFTWTFSFCQKMTFNEAVVMDLNFFYEYPDFRTPFDFTQNSDCNPTPLNLDFVSDNRLIISMTYADCYVSKDIEITVDSSLNVLSARISKFSDNLTDNDHKTTRIEQIILYLNKNPFQDTTNFIGHFSAIIKDTQNNKEFNYPFNGKFKVYSEKDRVLTSQQLRKKMEIDHGFVDKNGICELPEFDPKFCFGKDSLENFLTAAVLNHVNPEASSTKFYFTFVINNAGRVAGVNVKTKDGLDRIVKSKIENDLNNSCWIPAVNYGQTVKSTIYPWIEIK